MLAAETLLVLLYIHGTHVCCCNLGMGFVRVHLSPYYISLQCNKKIRVGIKNHFSNVTEFVLLFKCLLATYWQAGGPPPAISEDKKLDSVRG